MPLYYLENSRHIEQTEEMQRLLDEGRCIFCPDDARLTSGDSIVKVFDHWVVRKNTYPYKGTTLHLLVVPKRHVADLLDLPTAEQQEFWQAMAWIRSEFSVTHYGLGVRCGDGRYTGASIEHVHAHVIVADPDAPQRVAFKMGGNTADKIT